MKPVVAALAGLGAGVALWIALQDLFQASTLRRLNVRGRVVPVGGGIVLVLAVLVVAAGDALVDSLWDTTGRVVGDDVLLAVVGFGLLGLLDDLLESGDVKGFRGHVGSLVRGRLTTGAVKLVGGGLLALVVAPGRPDERVLWLLLDASLIALAANLANLLDRAPGRVTKVSILLGAALVATHLAQADIVIGGSLVGLAVVLGAAAALLVPDLREQVMLGDAGANVLGAVLGIAFVTHVEAPARVAGLVVLVLLNAASERVSFSRVIAATPVLRELDRLGRLPADDD